MALASLALRTTNFTRWQASIEWVTPSTRRARFLEISIIQATGTVQSLGLGRPAAQGVTPVPVLFQDDDSADVARVTSGSLSWATSPTAPTVYMRRWNSAATVGVGVVFT